MPLPTLTALGMGRLTIESAESGDGARSRGNVVERSRRSELDAIRRYVNKRRRGAGHRQAYEDIPMKTRRALTLLLAVLAATTMYGLPAKAAETAPATTPTATTPPKPPAVTPEVAGYDVGLMLGTQLQHDGVTPSLSSDALIRGLKDALGGRAITAEQRDAAVKFMLDARRALVEKNQTAGREFLAHNAKQPGVMTMPSGLQYRVLAAGDPNAKSPIPTDEVTVRYRASLADGTEFDRSDTHDRPATFRVNSVFKGWQEAVLAMKPGAKWQVFVPPELGYGANTPPPVPPGALLVYELELLRIEPAAPLDAVAAKRPPAAIVKPAAPPNP
jgi:FKBP-type peptidyl-prolyl cis-trans isomerase FklB